METLEQYIEEHGDELVGRLASLVRQPTISATGEGMLAGAALTAGTAQTCGVDARMIEGPGYPHVLGQAPEVKGAPTLLITTHYDVQPAEPLERWEVPPFELTMRQDGTMLGRGTTDAKGPVTAILAGVELLIQTRGAMPCNVKVLLDGEEEIGSPSMPWFVEHHQEELAADGVVTFDGNSESNGSAAINLGTGGLLYLALRVQTGQRDLHANLGALVPNAAWRLIWALASLKGPDESILIDDYETGLTPIRASEQTLFAKVPFDDETELRSLAVQSILDGRGGKQGPVSKHILPILGISGLQSGYDGEGIMAILPSEAEARLYIGLREAQQPDDILAKLRNHLERRGFSDIEVKVLGSSEPASCSLESTVAMAARRAAERTTGLAPAIYPRSSGYGRQGCWIAQHIGTDAAQVAAIGPNGARNHSANEFITRDYLLRGALLVAATIEQFARSEIVRGIVKTCG